MIPHAFRYEMPDTTEEAAAILADDPEHSTVVGGGTWVVPEMSQHVRQPATVIELRRSDARGIHREGDAVVIGAAATYHDLLNSDATPSLLRYVAGHITGGSQVRSQGTAGGSACYAYPGSDIPGAITALDATMRIRSARGVREVSVSEFFEGPFATCLAVDELLDAIVIDRSIADRAAVHRKFRVAEGSFPIATATCVADVDGRFTSVSIGAVAAKPFTVSVDADDGEAAVMDTVKAAVSDPWEDVLATGNFRRHLAGVMAWRAISAARDETSGGNS